MKQILTLVVLVAISLSSIITAKEAATLTPVKPKIGDMITLTYDPTAEGAVHKDASEIYAVVLFQHVNEPPAVLEKKMEKSGEVWMTTFTVEDPNAVSISVRYDAGEQIDDNNSNVQNIVLVGKNGKPVRGALHMKAMLHMQKNWAGFKHEQDSAKAKSLLKEEMKLYPDNWRAQSFIWTVESKGKNDDKIKKQIAKELAKVYNKQKNNEEAVAGLLSWFQFTDQTKKAEEIESAWLKKNPNGEIAKLKAYQAFAKETDQTKRAELASLYVEKFEVKRGMEQMFLAALLRVKNYEKAISFIEKYPNVSSSYYNSIAYGLISKGEQMEKALAIAQKGIAIAAKRDVRTDIGYLQQSHGQWEKDAAYMHGMIADTYGEGLMKVGKYEEAEKVLEESNTLMESDDPDNNARLVECYVKNGKNDKAISLSYASLVKGKGNQQLLEAYKTAYTTVKGSNAGFDSVLTVAKNESVKELKAKLKKEIIDQPSIDFELKSLDGSTVKLSDLKGKVVVLDFWATWCGPCISSFPSLQKVYDKYKANPNIKILAMNTWERVKPEEREQHVKNFIEKNNYTFPVLFDTDLVSQYGVSGIPTKFIIDQNGRIRFKDIGFGGAQEMENKMEIQFEMLLSGDLSLSEQ